MAIRAEAPPFDQGLYLLHLNKGREALRKNAFAEARLELQTASAMRPGDEDALNLMAVACFRLGDLEEAERLTRQLLASNPDSAILHSNLGVVLVKVGNLDEAEAELRRAIDLKPEHARSHLYLGFVYRQRGKLGLALEHFRFASADKLVAEVEEQMRRSSRETGELRAPRVTRRKAGATTGVLPSASAAAEAPEEGQQLFAIRSGGAVEIGFHGTLLVRRGTVASYSGRVAFAEDPKLSGTRAQSLLRASGQGTMIMADPGRHPLRIELANEFFSAEASRILAIGPGLSFRYEPIHDFPRRRRVDVLRIYGRGALVLSTARDTFTISVTADLPLSVSARDLVGWRGNLVPSVLPDRFLDEVMLPAPEEAPKIRFEGEGSVLTEAPA